MPTPSAAGERAGFVRGTREVLVDTRGRALIELSCPAGGERRCAIGLRGVTTKPLRKGRRARPLAVPRRRFVVRAGRVRAVPLPLPPRLRRALGPRGPRLNLVADHRGRRATATVSLRPATAKIKPGRDGRVRVLVQHAGDARRVRVRILQGRRVLSRGLVTKPRRGRVAPLRIPLRGKPRGSRPLRIAVTTIPVHGDPRTLAYMTLR